MAKETGKKVIARNRRARYDYHIEETFEAGLVLTGTEVKSLREGRASLTDGFGLIFQGEAWLEGVYIPEYAQGTWTNHSARRRRKMLLHRDEILKISHKLKESGRTLVPLELYFEGSLAKVEIAIARGKKDWDKRQALREKQDEREAQRAMSLRQHR
jgi:SsrA-binding protein